MCLSIDLSPLSFFSFFAIFFSFTPSSSFFLLSFSSFLSPHSKGNSGAKFKEKLSPLIQATQKLNVVTEWSFPNGPYEILDRPGTFQWWKLQPGVRSYQALTYEGIEESFNLILQMPPYDVVIGHSQGAIFASILLVQNILMNEQALPKAAILSGAAWPNPYGAEMMKLEDNFADISNRLFSVHCIGSNDTINPPNDARRLCRLFQGTELVHDKGHTIPLAPLDIRLYLDAIKKLL